MIMIIPGMAKQSQINPGIQSRKKPKPSLKEPTSNESADSNTHDVRTIASTKIKEINRVKNIANSYDPINHRVIFFPSTRILALITPRHQAGIVIPLYEM